MTLEVPVTELDAINTMLSSIGEAPVSTLSTGDLEEVSAAQAILKETSHALQMVGWQFNTEFDYPLVPDINGAITLPVNVVRVDQDMATDSGDYDLVQRGTQLYDRKNHTAVFTATIQCEVVFLLPFSSLPPIARRYITLKAARIFQARHIGSETLHAFTEEDEKDAKMAFEEAEGENTDGTIFDSSTFRDAIDRQR